MADSTTEKTPEPPKPTGNDAILVGDVNTTFDPLAPEDVAPADDPASLSGGDDAEAPPPPLQVAAASSDQKMLGCLRDILLVLISVILGAAFVLLILLGLNGTLFLNDRDETTYLKVTLKSMQQKQSDLEKQLNGQADALRLTDDKVKGLDDSLQTVDESVQILQETQQRQASEIEALQTRADETEQAVDATRQEVADIQENQEKLATQVAGVADQIDAIEDDIADFEKKAAQFDKFVTGLVSLIAEVAPEEMNAANPVTATVTPALTPEATPEASAAMTPTVNAPAPTPESSLQERFPPTRALPTPAPGRSILFGVAWLDANRNGAPDADETALPGVRITLLDEGGNPLLSMITGVDGRFAFLNVPPGRYQLRANASDDPTLIVPGPKTITAVADESLEINIGLFRQ